MQSNVIAKTGWVHRRREVVVILLCLIALAVVFRISLGNRAHILVTRTQHYSLEVATTEQAQDKGLSGRQSLGKHAGMLFVFQHASSQCFWMKGMHFPLDMIWTDAGHKVVHIEKDVSPDTYPRTFCSPDPASFVIELNAGEATNAGIYKGQLLTF